MTILCPHVQLQVSSEVKVGSALQSVSVDAAGFFDFAPLPMLEKVFTITVLQ